MSVATLRPYAAYGGDYGATPTGAATNWQATSDGSPVNDATYTTLAQPNGVQTLFQTAFGHGLWTIPANAIVQTVAARVRHNFAGTSNFNHYFQLGCVTPTLGDTSFATEYLATEAGLTTQTGTARPVAPDGSPWTQAAIDTLHLFVGNYDTVGASFRISELYVDVTYLAAPTATATGPNASVGTTRPIWAWTYSSPETAIQERFRVRIFTLAQTAAVGFDPNVTVPVVDSGEVFSNATSWTTTADLTDGTTYRAFIFVADAGSHGRYNVVTTAGPYDWATIAITPPAVPGPLSATAESATMDVVLTVTDAQNLFSANDAGIETSVGTWTATNGALARGTSAFSDGSAAEDGVASLRFTSNGAGNGTVTSGYYAIQPSTVYTGRVAPHAATTARQVRLDLQWADASNTPVATTTGTMVYYDPTVGWNSLVTSATAPSNAAKVRLVVTVISPANGEVHAIDNAVLIPGLLNLVSDPIFEADTNSDGVADEWTGYTAGTGAATYARDTSRVFMGLGSQKVTVTSDGAGSNFGGVSQAGVIPLVSGLQYTVIATVWVDRSCTFSLYSAQGDDYRPTLTPGQWNTVTHTFTATSTVFSAGGGAASGAFTIRAMANGVTNMWVGALQVANASGTVALGYNRRPWIPGGISTTSTYTLQRTTDGGVSWQTLTRIFVGTNLDSSLVLVDPASNAVGALHSNGAITMRDFELPRGVVPQYRIRSRATVNGNAVASAWAYSLGAAPLPYAVSWIKDPTDWTRNIAVNLDQHEVSRTRTTAQGQHYAVGRGDPIIVYGTTRLGVWQLILFFQNDSTYNAWLTLQDSQRTLLLQSGYGDLAGKQWYFTIDPDVQDETLTVPRQASAQAHRVTLTAREAATP